MDILKLSYDSLPQRLKPCFLYLGIYPENYEINARILIQLWTVEGFIQPQESGIQKAVEPEDIADYYLDELVDRNLVQVASRRSDGGVKTCRIHDLLRDLCILESKSEKFIEVCAELNNMDTLINANPRRLSFHCQVGSNVSTDKLSHRCTRSLFFFAKQDRRSGVNTLKNFKLVRLIHCTAEALCPLPSDIKKLIHPRNARLRYKGTASSEIWKLKRLRHLYLRGNSSGSKLPTLAESDSERESNMQTLWLMSEDQQIESVVRKDIFPRLRKLVLCNLYGRRELLVPSLQHLSNLYCLKIRHYAKLPSKVNEFPLSLTKISLENVGHKELFLTILKTLALLTNLQTLKLKGSSSAYRWWELNIGTGEFPQLQVFEMKSIPVTLWRMEEGAMPHLRHIVIEHCNYLNELPQQLWSLTTLRQVNVLNSSPELASNLQTMKLKNDCKLFTKK